MNEAESQPAIEVEASELALTKAAQQPNSDTMTSAQAKVDAIAALTKTAYAKASELLLSDDEVKALLADFPDEAFKQGAAGKENLIYIEHAFLRERLNQIFKPGQWAIVPRSRWAEPFKTSKGLDATRVYVEAMLCIRGCFAAEAVGEMEYFPHNASQNYGDAVEGAKSAALRRCAKELGIGLQAWKKDWCEGWWSRRSVPRPPSNATQPIKTPVAPAQVAKKAAVVAEKATEAMKKRMIELLEPARQHATQYFIETGKLMPNEALEDLPLDFVVKTKQEMDWLFEHIRDFSETGRLPEKTKPTAQTQDYNSPTAPWRSFPIPFGKQAGIALAAVEKNFLYGFWAGFKVTTEFNGKPKKPESIAKDQVFRDMLNEAGKHYGFNVKASPAEGELPPDDILF